MSISVVHIPPGAKVSHRELLTAALNAGDAGSSKDHSTKYIISPTRHLLNDRMQTVHKALGNCYIPPVMMTLNQLASLLVKTHSRKAAFPDEFRAPAISSLMGIGIGHATLTAEFIAEIKNQFPGATAGEVRTELLKAFGGEYIPDEIAKRAYECLGFMEKYDNALAQAGLTDSTDTLVSATGLVKHLDISLLVLDGFYELTPAELGLAGVLITEAKTSLVLIPISHPDDDLSYCCSKDIARKFNVTPQLLDTKGVLDTNIIPEAPDYLPAKGLEEEVETMARDIKANYLNSRNRLLDDTWIVFPKLPPYRAIIKRVLNRYGIPHSFSTGVSLADTPAYQDLLSMLEAAAGGLPRVPFSRMLHSPYFRNIPAEIRASVPSVSLSTGIVSGADAWRRAFKSKGLLKEINIVIKALSPLTSNYTTASYGALLNALLDVLLRLGFEPSDEGLSETEEALGSLALLDSLSGPEVGLPEFTDAVKRALGAKRLVSQASGVRVAELFEVRGLEPAVLYLGGLKDGDIPASTDIDFILPERVRKQIGLLDMNRFMHLQARIFRRLCASAGKVCLSYPKMEGDKLYLPSIFLSGGKEKDASIKGIYCHEERLTATRTVAHGFAEITGVSFSRKGSALRVTDIDSYRSCPRKHYIEHVLGLAPPELADYEVEARELGTIVHKVMEKLISDPLPGIEEFRARALEALDQVLAKTGLDEYMSGLTKESFLGLIEDIYALEEKLQDEGITRNETEVLVEEQVDGIALKGKIDRIAHSAQGVSLIDYKTGMLKISAVSALRGENLQLYLYALMLEARGFNVQRVGIYSLKDIRVKWVPNKSDLDKGNDLSVIAAAARGFLKSTVEEMQKGHYPALPQKEQPCMNCLERPYCPYIHGETDSQENQKDEDG